MSRILRASWIRSLNGSCPVAQRHCHLQVLHKLRQHRLAWPASHFAVIFAQCRRGPSSVLSECDVEWLLCWSSSTTMIRVALPKPESSEATLPTGFHCAPSLPEARALCWHSVQNSGLLRVCARRGVCNAPEDLITLAFSRMCIEDE